MMIFANKKAGPLSILGALLLITTLGLAAAPVMAKPGSGSPPCHLPGPPGDKLPGHCGDPVVERQLEALRKATTPFYSFDVALAAGWDLQMSGCVESPAGGMGYHYGNVDQLAQAGNLSLFRPEALLYMPLEDGSMEFVAVEYIVAGDDWPHAEPPEFLGQHLHYNPILDIWALHVWIARENPAGIFEDWNPEVHCDFASD